MFVIASETLVAAPPARVWALLTAFDGYPAWTRSVQLAGQPIRGAGLDYRATLSLAGRPARPMTLPAIVHEADPGRILAWELGLPGLITLRFSFEIAPAPGGAQFRHVVRIGGVLGAFAPGRFERMLGPTVRLLVADAARALAPVKRPPARPMRPKRRR